MGEPWRPRLALVVGVKGYKKKPLKNSLADACQIERKLQQRGGFDVRYVPEPKREQLLTEILKFGERISQKKKEGHGCVAVFYYAGHGLLDSTGKHCLLPVNWEVESFQGRLDHALKVYGIALNEVLQAMKSAYAAIVLIDACQEQPNLPLKRARSLSQASSGEGLTNRPVEAATWGWRGDAIGSTHHRQNLLVAHACAPRRSASDGLRGQGTFTHHLLKVSQLDQG